MYDVVCPMIFHVIHMHEYTKERVWKHALCSMIQKKKKLRHPEDRKFRRCMAMSMVHHGADCPLQGLGYFCIRVRV